MAARPRNPWWSGPARRLHAMLVLGLVLCTVGSYVEWTRALHGHTVAWAYAVEWPLLGVLGAGMWWRLLRTEVGQQRPRRPARRRATPSDIPADDVDLLAWQHYLHELHANDPPGGPPR